MRGVYQIRGLGTTLSAKHIQSTVNVLADASSQRSSDQTEWIVVQDGGRRGSRFWVSPELDMFATQMNNQLPVFVSPMPNPLALEYDALSMVWTRRD